jgi:hypothetical protein
MAVQVVDFNPFERGAETAGPSVRDEVTSEQGASNYTDQTVSYGANVYRERQALTPGGVRGGRTGVMPQPQGGFPEVAKNSSTPPSSSSGKSKDGKVEISAAARDEVMRVLMPGNKLGIEEGRGFASSVAEVGNQLRQKASEARQPFYEEAFRQGAEGLDLTDMAGDPMFAIAMQRAERTMADKQAMPGVFSTGSTGPNGQTLEYWDQVRQRLDDMHRKAIAAKSPRAVELDTLRQDLRERLNKAFPKYASARGAAELFFNASDAFEAGTKFARGRYPLDAAAQAIAAMSGEEKKLFTEGFATAFVEDVRAAPDRAALLDRINAGETGRNKVRVALGAKADQLEAFLRLEGLMAGAGDDPAGKMAEMIVSGSAQTETPVNARVAEHIAGMLTSKNPDIFLTGLKQVAKPNVLEGLRQLGAGGANVYRERPDEDPVIAKARDAVARGADRTAVMRRLQENGITPKGV